MKSPASFLEDEQDYRPCPGEAAAWTRDFEPAGRTTGTEERLEQVIEGEGERVAGFLFGFDEEAPRSVVVAISAGREQTSGGDGSNPWLPDTIQAQVFDVPGEA
jgi:hypothetical protein